MIKFILSVSTVLLSIISYADEALIYGNQAAAMKGCETELHNVMAGNIGVYRRGSCYNEYKENNLYVARAKFEAMSGAIIKSSYAHFGIAKREYGSYSISKNQAKNICVEKKPVCSAKNLADAYLGKSERDGFSNCSVRGQKYVHFYQSGRGVCEIKFGLPPEKVSSVTVSGLSRIPAGGTPLFSTEQKENVWFRNDLDRTFTGAISWSYPEHADRVRIQVKIDFGPEWPNIQDIDWSEIRDIGTAQGVFSKASGITKTYFRTLPEPLYTWFYTPGSPRFVLTSPTDTKYVHIHYRLRGESSVGNSEWVYLKPVSIYHGD